MPNPNLKAGPGRPKGLPNKATVAAKEAIQMAFDGIGGVPTLIAWAKEPKNQGEFYKLFVKLIPVQVTGENGEPIKIEITPTQATIA